MLSIRNLLLLTLFIITYTACSKQKVKHSEELPSEVSSTLQYVDPLVNVLKESNSFKDIPAKRDVAKGEYANLQFAFRSEEPTKNLSATVELEGFTRGDIQIGYVGYVGDSRGLFNPAPDMLNSPSGQYPDPIFDKPPKDIPARSTLSIWVNIKIPKNMEAGEYQGVVKIKGGVGDQAVQNKKEFKIKVYPVTIDSTSLWVTNWYWTDPFKLGLMNNGNEVKTFSLKYWRFIDIIAKKMAEYNQNVIIVPPLELTKYTLEGTKYTFDFSNFDRMVSKFQEAGALKRIEGRQLGRRLNTGDLDSELGLYVPKIWGDGTSSLEAFPLGNPKVSNFYAQFIPAFRQHLKDKGYEDIYLQHIADEPNKNNAQSYIDIVSYLRRLDPEMKIIESATGSQLKGILNVWVPPLEDLAENYSFYKNVQAEGTEVWYYTYLKPQGKFANRLIRLPLIKTELLHWINFKYGITGYLHWGYNFYWNSDYLKDASAPNGDFPLPAGDSYIVYPGFEKLYSSIRLEAMRDGINDYELLKMLSKKDPQAAKEIVDKTVQAFDSYDTDIRDFRNRKRQILELLSN